MKKLSFSQLFKLSTPKETGKYINFAFGGLILTLMLIILFAGGFFFRSVMNEEEDRLSQIITEILAKAVNKVSFSGKYHSRLLLEEIKLEQPGIKYLQITDINGNILAHSDSKKNDQTIDSTTLSIIKEVVQDQKPYTRHRNLNNETVREVSLPYRGGYNKKIIGVLQVGLSTQLKDDSIKEGILFLIILLILLLIIGILITHYISISIVKPIKQLANDMEATLLAIPDLLFELDSDGKYLQVMTNKKELLADTRKRLLNRSVIEMMPSDAAKIVMNAIHEADVNGESYGHEFKLTINKQTFWFELSIAKKQTLASDRILEKSQFIVLSRDITQRKKDEQEITYLAHNDTLTGLANRYSLESRMEQALLDAQRINTKLDILFIDMDHFKNINDTLGHHIGDLFLKDISLRLQSCVRKSDIVGRLGGDEFIVILNNMSSISVLDIQSNKILSILSQPYKIQTHKIHSSCSIGISQFPNDGDNVELLMKNADTAMYHAKKVGRNNFQFYSKAMTEDNEKRLQLESDLHIAIKKKQFQLYYQPQISIKTQKICGVEALIRWTHPHKGIISPLDFIPVAEESNLIIEIGNWVIDEAFRQKSIWEAESIKGMRMSLNLSAQQLHSKDLVAFIKKSLVKHHLEGSQIEMEITESVAMDNPEEAISILNELRALDISLAIDDFGTGYSSLAYLKRLPIQTLKVDREFIRDIETDSNDAAICSATIALAHSLGLKVVAEGIENKQQEQFLIYENCDILQGFYYAKPLPNEELIKLYNQFSFIKK